MPLLLPQTSRNQSHGHIIEHSEIIADEKAEFNFIDGKDNQNGEFISDSNLIKNEQA